MSVVHGGPDALGIAAHDFSTNANACGPCPEAEAALRHADRSRYPDPAYTALRARLAAFHGVAPGRIVVAGSASEFIHRITACAARRGVRHVVLPAHGYGDYARAAQAWGLQGGAHEPALHWACEPASPLGTEDAALARWACQRAEPGALRVIDCAYAPLRLAAAARPLPADAWQLWTPNKALGLTGVRGAYAIAPATDAGEVLAAELQTLAPSWPLGADGVALLQSWTEVRTQAWLAASLHTLRDWKARQLALCASQGWSVVPGSLANYFAARLPVAGMGQALQVLRARGVKLRDCASFGLPGHVRLGVLPPASQRALADAWNFFRGNYHCA